MSVSSEKRHVESPKAKPAPISAKVKDKKKNSKKADREQGLNSLKAKHRNEMLNILDKEEEKESQREKMVAEANTEEEKLKLEEKFGIERAKACELIDKTGMKHRKAEQALANKLGVLLTSNYF